MKVEVLPLSVRPLGVSAQISTASKGKDKKAAKAPAEGGRGRKRKASADPGDDADAGGRPALLVPGPPSMQARPVSA